MEIGVAILTGPFQIGVMPTFRLLRCWLFGIFCGTCFLPALTAASGPQAGWATVEITPAVGIGLGGRGHNVTVSKQIKDPLSAQVFLLKDGHSNQLAMISFDLVGLPHDLSDQIRKNAVAELGIPWNLVILNSSHTHSGPNMLRTLLANGGKPTPEEAAYFETLPNKITAALRTARKHLQPVRVEVFSGTTDVAINRRGTNRLGEVSLLPNPTGRTDKNLWVLRATPLRGGAPGLLFSAACHPVIVYGYAGAAISADFPGQTREKLRTQLGEQVHVQFLQGFAGNVRPRSLANLEKNTFGNGGPAALAETSTQLAQDVLATLEKPGTGLDLDIAGAEDRPFLPRGTPPPRITYEEMAKKPTPGEQASAAYWLARYDTGEGFAQGDAWPVGLIRLSKKQWIVCMAGEPVVEWRDKVSTWLKGRPVVTWGYCQEAITYLPTEKLLPEGGYEVLSCNLQRSYACAPFTNGMEAAVQESLERQLRFIEAKKP